MIPLTEIIIIHTYNEYKLLTITLINQRHPLCSIYFPFHNILSKQYFGDNDILQHYMCPVQIEQQRLRLVNKTILSF